MGLQWLLVIGLISSSFATPLFAKSSMEESSFKRPFNFDVTEKSASIFKVELDEESKGIFVAKEPSMKLVFEEEAGSPRWSPSCPEQSHCLQWVKDGQVNGEMVINPFDKPPSTPGTSWQVVTNGPPHTYIIDYTGHYLYGGPLDLVYPSNANVKVNAPAVTTDDAGVNLATNVVERVWAASNGRSIRVSEDTPLFISQNQTTLLLSARNEPPFPTKKTVVSSLVTMCLAGNIKDTWKCIQGSRNTIVTNLIMTEYPTLTTWAEYKRDISQDIVVNFAKEASDNGISVAVIAIDDGWETCYGSQTFNSKFPDPKKMVADLVSMGHKVTLWVHPFVNLDCGAYDQLKDYLLKYENGSIVNTAWWNGKAAALINFLDDAATTFYYNRLKKLQADFGVHGFKFDAGASAYITEMNKAISIDLPNKYTQNYVAMAAKLGSLGEVRVGAGTTDQNIRMRIQDTNSVWDQNGGLRTVILSTLQLSIVGYKAIIPDMVGGNEYGNTADKELFIRWLQMSTFMPYLQLSVAPWKFDSETLQLSQQLLKLHGDYSLFMFMHSTDTKHERPTIAPLWWLDPTDDKALTCYDEFLLGGTILVAPVIEKGAITRDVYLPTGFWVDMSNNRTYEGPTVITDYDAPLNKLPWFQKFDYY